MALAYLDNNAPRHCALPSKAKMTRSSQYYAEEILNKCSSELEEGPKRYNQLAVMSKVRASSVNLPRLSNQSQPDRLHVATAILLSNNQKKMDLISLLQVEGDVVEELVLRVQGYVIQTHLPLITTASQYVDVD